MSNFYDENGVDPQDAGWLVYSSYHKARNKIMEDWFKDHFVEGNPFSLSQDDYEKIAAVLREYEGPVDEPEKQPIDYTNLVSDLDALLPSLDTYSAEWDEANRNLDRDAAYYEAERKAFIDSIPFEFKAHYKGNINDYIDSMLAKKGIIKPGTASAAETLDENDTGTLDEDDIGTFWDDEPTGIANPADYMNNSDNINWDDVKYDDNDVAKDVPIKKDLDPTHYDHRFKSYW